MRKTRLACALLAITALSACAAGPHQLNRTVDDWDAKMYTSSPWLDGVLWFIPVFPICHLGAQIGDFFIGDAYSFWFKDAWDGKGTGFNHYTPEATDGSMGSLLLDDGKFLEVK